MNIAIDFDDCISNTKDVDFATCWEYNKKINPNDKTLYKNNHHNAPTIFNFDKATDDDFYIKQRKQVIEEGLIYPKAFADKVINNLIADGHNIIILTSRSDKFWGDAELQTKLWLNKFGINFNKLVVNCSEKGLYCKVNNVDVLIEDNVKYAKQANDQNISSILMLEDYNQYYDNKLNTFASCWPEVYAIINKM